MTDWPGTTRDYLGRQYADDANLRARQSIYAYQRPRLDLYAASLELARLAGDEAVVDVGCGNGGYLATLAGRGHRGPVCAVDLSPGMLRAARERASGAGLLAADAQALPLRDSSFDVALAMHMLYHVPDRGRALAELRRVVRPGGTVLVLTNSEAHFRELDQLLVECAAATVDASFVRPRSSLVHYTVERGAPELEAVFADVALHRFDARLVLDRVEPVIAYASSLGSFVTADGVDRELVLAELARRVSAVVAADGAFEVTTACGCFVCR